MENFLTNSLFSLHEINGRILVYTLGFFKHSFLNRCICNIAKFIIVCYYSKFSCIATFMDMGIRGHRGLVPLYFVQIYL